MKIRLYIIAVIAISIISIFSSCFDEKIRDDTDTVLLFSQDTLRFDTVFTTVGSVTRSFKVYNPYSESVIIDRIFLEDQASGTYRLNIDGQNTNTSDDKITLLPNDSLYVFAEATINPNEPLSSSPFIIEDYVSFVVNGNTQRVLLEAFGQNANYVPTSKKGNGVISLCNNFETITFDDPKPYVIYGILLVDSCTLSIPAGAKIYVHGGLAYNENQPYNDGIIAVSKAGSLNINGTVESPVTIQGDRLESQYADIAGQWAGIIFLSESKNNSIEHAIIKNAVNTIRIDSLASLTLKNTVLSNQSSSAIVGTHVDQVYLENCLIERFKGNGLNLGYGGHYEINYSTIAGFNSSGAAIGASNYKCKDPKCETGYNFHQMNLKVNNTICVGQKSDQIILIDKSPNNLFNYEFNNSIVQVDELLDTDAFADFFSKCYSCLEYQSDDNLFADRYEQNYELDSLSIAIEKAVPISTIPTDILERPRDLNTPDIGAYEFQ